MTFSSWYFLKWHYNISLRALIQVTSTVIFSGSLLLKSITFNEKMKNKMWKKKFHNYFLFPHQPISLQLIFKINICISLRELYDCFAFLIFDGRFCFMTSPIHFTPESLWCYLVYFCLILCHWTVSLKYCWGLFSMMEKQHAIFPFSFVFQCCPCIS